MENKVKEKRLEKNMTQAELAYVTKVSSRTIISIENGKYKPSILLAYKLSKVFDLSIEELFDLEKELQEEENAKQN